MKNAKISFTTTEQRMCQKFLPAIGSMVSRLLDESPDRAFPASIARRVRVPPPRPGWGILRTCLMPPSGSSWNQLKNKHFLPIHLVKHVQFCLQHFEKSEPFIIIKHRTLCHCYLHIQNSNFGFLTNLQLKSNLQLLLAYIKSSCMDTVTWALYQLNTKDIICNFA